MFGDELTETESEDEDWDDSELNKKQFLNILRLLAEDEKKLEKA